MTKESRFLYPALGLVLLVLIGELCFNLYANQKRISWELQSSRLIELRKELRRINPTTRAVLASVSRRFGPEQVSEGFSSVAGMERTSTEKIEARVRTEGDALRDYEQKFHQTRLVHSDLGREHTRLERVLWILIGDNQYANRRPKDALKSYRQALPLFDQGQEPVLWSEAAFKLISVLRFGDPPPDARLLMEEIVKTRSAALGRDHPDTVLMVTILANWLRAKGDTAAAISYYRLQVESEERRLGPDHQDTLGTKWFLAALLQSEDHPEAAEMMARESLAGTERSLGPDHVATISSVRQLAGILSRKGDLAGAEALYRRALETDERVAGPQDLKTLRDISILAALLKQKGDMPEAENYYRRALETSEQVFGREHPSTLSSAYQLAAVLFAEGKKAEALPLAQRAYDGLSANPDPRRRNPEKDAEVLRERSELLRQLNE